MARVWPESASQTRAVLSNEAVTIPLAVGAERGGVDPFGVPLEGGDGLAGVGVPDPRRVVSSPEAVTTRLPSGLNAAELTAVGVPRREARVLPESASQTRAVLSTEAVTTRLPSGLNAAEKTCAVCPWRVARVWPESASQTRAVSSSEAVTIRLPSGLNAAEWTIDVCPWR